MEDVTAKVLMTDLDLVTTRGISALRKHLDVPYTWKEHEEE